MGAGARLVGVLAALLLLALLACKNHDSGGNPGAAEPPLPAQPAGVGAPPPAAPSGPAPSFTLSSTSIKKGESVTLTFSTPVQPASGRYWITIVSSGQPDTKFEDRQFVPTGASSMRVTPEATGSLEVRLHDTYPAHFTRVLQRVRLEVVDGAAEAAPRVEAKPSPKCYPDRTYVMCTCSNGARGTQYCNAAVGWSACKCAAECRDGQEVSCRCPQGGNGVRVCNKGTWNKICGACD